MGKNNRRSLVSSKRQKPTSKGSKPNGVAKTKKPAKPLTKQQLKAQARAQDRKPVLPFAPSEHILLIGEGDLSFARSLIEHHGCENVTATVYESEVELKEKYPQSLENISAIEEGGGIVRYGIDAVKMKPWTEGLERRGTMDRVFFNFPHVGGKSTDVNRQVRYNQELLVAFFKTALPSLSPRHGSSIIVTLFEGEPYTLWNIKDLGRHAGLQVEQSFKFQASAYPGYKHARTLGVVKGKGGEVTGGAWKGEERRARSFVFVRKGEAPLPGVGVKAKKVESSEDEEEEVDEGDDGLGSEGGEIEENDDDEIRDEEELRQG